MHRLRNQENMKIPKHILQHKGMTARQWKASKRMQARLLERYLDILRFGCAYTPAVGKIDRITKLLRELRESLKVKNWGT